MIKGSNLALPRPLTMYKEVLPHDIVRGINEHLRMFKKKKKNEQHHLPLFSQRKNTPKTLNHYKFFSQKSRHAA